MNARGTFRAYREPNFRADKMEMIGRIASILDPAETRGEVYSVRQIYYQFVKNNWLPNEGGSYNKVQAAINDGRMAGLLSWTAIEDRGRDLMGYTTYNSPQEAVETLEKDYKTEVWASQPSRPEVWVEKAALVSVVGSICDLERVDFYATRGYDSQSAVWRAARRFTDYISRGQRPVVLHLGDHDPSGLDMTRDITERLQTFVGVPVQVIRLALNMSQVQTLALPPNPAKLTDARAVDYVAKYGSESWELDALDNDYIRRLIRDAVESLRDQKLWDEALMEEIEDREQLQRWAEKTGDD